MQVVQGSQFETHLETHQPGDERLCSTLITYSVAGPSNLAPETVCITGSILNTCTDPNHFGGFGISSILHTIWLA